MRYIYLFAIWACFTAAIKLAHATDNGQYANSPNKAWYEAQELTPETQVRLSVSWKSCCLHSEVFRTNFRVNKTNGDDEWWYELPTGAWKLVPADTVHWGDFAPDGQPTLFIYSGIETCFFPGESGG